MNESAYFWFAVLWMAAVGGSVGSFLNVVVYRLPAGLSLSYPSSHCPRCQHAIRWHDNVPVLGWLMLRGRCRDCKGWIPVRYPAVEAAVAVLFVVIVIAEGASLGGNLPARPEQVVDGLIYRDLTILQLAGLLGWHLLLLCTLLPAALIRYDGHEVPARLFIAGLATAAIGSVVWPHLHPQPAFVSATGPSAGIVDALAGLAAGAAIGWTTWRLFESSHRPDLAWAAALVGMMLGWQPVIVIGAATVIFTLITTAAARLRPELRRLPAVAWLGLFTMIWIVRWADLAETLFGIPRSL